jgi:hypothetical protein
MLRKGKTSSVPTPFALLHAPCLYDAPHFTCGDHHRHVLWASARQTLCDMFYHHSSYYSTRERFLPFNPISIGDNKLNRSNISMRACEWHFSVCASYDRKRKISSREERSIR